MKIYNNIGDLRDLKYPVVTTGGFDGVHIGHMKILNRMASIAKENNGESLVFTFHPHPRLVLFPDSKIQILTTEKEKIELLEKAKIDNLLIYPFTKEFSNLTSEKFIRNILAEKLKAKKLILGYDHHFGNDRQGDYSILEKYSKIYKFEVEEINELMVNDEPVSSTLIRTALNNGEIKQANKLLGYNYNISGKVIKGRMIGRSIGFPTANLEIDDKNKLIPPSGIYAAKVNSRNRIFNGMLYIGNRPTLPYGEFAIEVNILDFDEDIYDENIRIYFIDKIREDIKFENLDQLKIQIEKDKESILNIIRASLKTP